ncbi:Trypanosomal VSG domain containing protein, putative [Trypanosoma equiperdum]|uniref:Trypanosomal VSG domain containing protein, putative n=1 Tax=Trypanosoma equiperdum TaxID=5694 RepID=A0A1G4I7J8_TRYEQ|nr:Trypanosomal VSG domain containing protein, putative [Trypanosoma equiperdum]
MNFNATSSRPEWRQMFDTAEGKQGWAKYKEAKKDALGAINWEDRWEDWKAAHEKTKDDDKPWHKKHNTKASKHLTPQRAHFINASAEEALGLQQQINSPPQTGTKPLAEEINELLDAARCTKPPATAPANPTCADVGVKEKTTTCTTNNTGKSLAVNLACLCAVTNAADSCSSADNIQANVLSTDNFAATALKTIEDLCPKSLGEMDLDNAITQALQNL